MKFLRVLSLLFFYSLSVTAQDNHPDTRLAMQNVKELGVGGSWIPAKPANTYIKGSQYLFNSWAGRYTVVSKKGVISQTLNLNYNIMSKKLESYIAKDSVFQYDLEQFDYIEKYNSKYKVFKNNQLEGLFQELFSNGKIAFYKEVIVSVQEGTINPLTQELIGENEYVKKNIYFINSKEKFEKIKLNKKDILKSLLDKEELIKTYVKENMLTYSSEEDVIKILTYYNTI